jgi:hypothetical protein
MGGSDTISGRGRRRLVRSLLAAALALAVACGGDEGADLEPVDAADADEAVDVTEDLVDVEVDDDAAPVFTGERFTVGHRVWHNGFMIEFGDAAVQEIEDSFGNRAPVLAIDATFHNEGADTNPFRSEAVVAADGKFLFLAHGFSDLPDVPGGLAGAGRFVFGLDEPIDMATAALIIGSSQERQTRVPLGPQAGELVTYEPVEVALSGEISLEPVDVILTSGVLRADRPVNHSQVEAGKLALTLNLEALVRTSRSLAMQAREFALILPSGLAVVPEGSGLGVLDGSEDGILNPDLYVRFVVDDPPTGSYTLRYTAPSHYVSAGEETEGELTFTLD